MKDFNFVKSAEEICEAIAGNDYYVEVNSFNHSTSPSVETMNKDGLFLTYSKLDAPEKKYTLLVENEFEIANHVKFNNRLIKHMLQTYGDDYLKKVTIYLKKRVMKRMESDAKDLTKVNVRLKEDLEPYNDIFAEVKREAAAAAKAEAEKSVNDATEEKPTEAE